LGFDREVSQDHELRTPRQLERTPNERRPGWPLAAGRDHRSVEPPVTSPTVRQPTPVPIRPSLRWLAVLFGAAIVLVGPGCGVDGGDDASRPRSSTSRPASTTTTTTATTTSTTTSATGEPPGTSEPTSASTTTTSPRTPTGKAAKFCEADAALDKALDGNDGDLDGPTIAAAVRKAKGLLDQYEANAPDRLRGDAHIVVAAVREVAAQAGTLDPGRSDSKQKLAALIDKLSEKVDGPNERLKAYVAATCPKG